MAPEQARGRAVDRRADIWAFGNVVYELLTGRRAFEGEDVADIVAKILEREPDWAALPPSTPPDLRRLLVRCLMKDPKARLRDIGEARVTIDALLRGETQTADSPSPFAPPGRGTVLLPWTIAAALAVVVAFFFIQRARPSSPSQVAHVDISLPADVEVYNGPSISADGTTIVFVGVRGSTRQVFLRSLNEAEVRQIAGTETASTVAIGPDGLSAVFIMPDTRVSRVVFASGIIERLSTGAGVGFSRPAPAVRSCSAAGRKWTVPSHGGTHPLWSADGHRIFYRSSDQVLAVDMTTTPASRTCCSTSTSASATASRLRATASVTTAASS
jgi:hypothetical protein